MVRYRIEWREGPRLIGGDTWVIDLDLLASSTTATYRLAKKLQVIATTEDLAALGGPAPDWTFWRALVEVASGIIVRRVDADELHLEHPRAALQVAPDLADVLARTGAMLTEPVAESELISEFATA